MKIADEVAKKERDVGHVAYFMDTDYLAKEGVIDANAIKEVRLPGFDLARRWLGSESAAEFNRGCATSILQLVGLHFALNDLKSADELNVTEFRLKVGIAVVGLSANVVETVAATVEGVLNHPLSSFIRVHWAVEEGLVGKVVKGARIIGAGAGVAAASCDLIFKVPEAFHEDNVLLARLYAGNGLLGVGISLAMYRSAAIIYWPLFILSIGVGNVIGIVRESALRRWISNCYFSIKQTKNEGNFSTLKEELIGYRHAMENHNG